MGLISDTQVGCLGELQFRFNRSLDPALLDHPVRVSFGVAYRRRQAKNLIKP